MIGMKFTGKLLFFLSFCWLTSTAKVTITCDAPSVRDGQPATLTCDFKRDVSALSSATVTVEHYPDGSPDPTPVLECTPVGAKCTLPVPGYEFNNQINTKLVLKITSASKENSGRFACKMLSPDLAKADDVEPCVFTVDVESTTTSITSSTNGTTTTTKPDLPIAAIVGGAIAAVFFIAVVVGIIVCIIFRKKIKKACKKKKKVSIPRPETVDLENRMDEYGSSENDTRSAQRNDGQTQRTPLLPPRSNTSVEPGVPVAGGSNENDQESGDTASSMAPAVKPDMPVAGGSDGTDLESGETASLIKGERHAEPAIGDDGSSDDKKALLEESKPGGGSVDTSRRQDDEINGHTGDNTIHEDTVDTPRTPAKDGSREDTHQEQGVDESKSPRVGELTSKFEQISENQ